MFKSKLSRQRFCCVFRSVYDVIKERDKALNSDVLGEAVTTNEFLFIGIAFCDGVSVLDRLHRQTTDTNTFKPQPPSLFDSQNLIQQWLSAARIHIDRIMFSRAWFNSKSVAVRIECVCFVYKMLMWDRVVIRYALRKRQQHRSMCVNILYTGSIRSVCIIQNYPIEN